MKIQKSDQNFPLIEYAKSDSPKQWGQKHGEHFRAGIKELYTIRKELMLAKSPHLQDKLDELALIQYQTTKKQCPQLVEELDGIIEGSALGLTEIVVLNNYTDFRDITLEDEGCSTVHLQNDKGVFSGQTWDMHGSARDYLCLIHTPKTNHQSESLVLSLVGCLGLMGMNTQKNLIGVNNINTLKAKAGLIWPALVRQCLMANSFEGMRQFLQEAEVTSGHNYMISSNQGGEHWEISPKAKQKVSSLGPHDQGVIYHTNHCLGSDNQKLEMKNSLSSTTHARYDLIQAKASKAHDFESLYQLLTDHENYPKSICSHYTVAALDPSYTCGGGVAEMKTGKVRFWRGCPLHDSNFKQYDYKLENNHFVRV